MENFQKWTILNEGGITGPTHPQYQWNGEKLISQKLPMRDMSEQGMKNLVRYLHEAGQDVVHDPERNATYIKLEIKSEGISYLVLNYDGTWHFERKVK